MGGAFYRNSECCVLCFDLTEPKTFETIDTWRTEFINQLQPKDPESFPFVILGNKCDKEGERKVPESKIKQYCAAKGNIQYFETSAKENINVEKAFEEVARLALKREQRVDDNEVYSLIFYLILVLFLRLLILINLNQIKIIKKNAVKFKKKNIY